MKLGEGSGRLTAVHRKTHKGSLGYMPGLDGLRALAVFAVIAYHLDLPWAQGGLLGVNLFFVLSGYLITNILLTQWDGSRSVDFKNFWIRRIRRLMPALFVMVAGVMLWIMFFSPERMDALKGEMLAAVTYTSNWYLVFHQVSYFESFGPPSPFGHLWSLAVEAQFYLFWPLLLGWGLRYLPKRKWLAIGTLLIALLSLAAMALIYTPGQDPSRVYYGTDTRIFDLLVGGLLAMAWPNHSMSVSLTGKKRQILDLVGSIGLAAVIWMIVMTNQYQGFLYQGGLFLFSLGAACLIAALVHPASYLSKLFAWSPLRWLGKCSYGIYLWHFPVIVLTNPVVNTGGLVLSRALLQVVASIVLAALSLYLIEQPVRYGKRGSPPVWNSNFWGRHKVLFYIGKLSASVLLALTILSVTPNDAAQTSAKDLARAEAVEILEVASTLDSTPALDGEAITVIGDSLMVGIESSLVECFPGIVVDAQQSRQMEEALDVIAELDEKSCLRDIVVLELGTNGPFTEKQLLEVLDNLGDCERIFLVNTRVPKPWENTVNQTMAEVARSNSNVELLDWYAVSRGQDDFFYADGVHLQPTGIEAYLEMIAQAINSYQG